MANQHDQRLIQQTLDGHPEAFGELIQRYQDRLFNGMFQIVRNEAEAEDVVQDALLLAFRKLSTFQGNSAFFYLAVSDQLQRSDLSTATPATAGVSLDGQAEMTRLDLEDAAPPPDHRLEQQDDLGQLQQALDRLSVEHREILVLREIEEFDYDAISEILDLPVGTVRSRLHRARCQLKETLEAIINSRGTLSDRIAFVTDSQ